MNEREHPSYYAILTADVRYDKRLKPAEKILFSEITALSNIYGYCYASNSYFCDLYGVSIASVKGWIANLKRCGYVGFSMISALLRMRRQTTPQTIGSRSWAKLPARICKSFTAACNPSSASG